MSGMDLGGPVWSNGSVPEGTVVGRVTGGNVAALTAAQVANVLSAVPTQSDISSGESNISRAAASGSCGQLSTGILYLVYFTARKTESVVSLRVGTNTTAAGATPTLCKVGFYSVASPYDETADLTLLGSTANDTSLFSAASTMYTRALTAPASKVAGQRYAVGVLVVSGAAMPSLQGVAASGAASSEWAVAPIMSSYIASQSDIAGNVTSTLTVPSSRLFYAAALPS